MRSLEASSLVARVSPLVFFYGVLSRPFINNIKKEKERHNATFLGFQKRHYLKYGLESANFRSSSLVVSSASRDSIYSRPHYTQERGSFLLLDLLLCNSLQNIRTKKCGGSAWCCVETPTLRRRRWSSLAAVVVVVVVVVLGAFEDDEEGPPQ